MLAENLLDERIDTGYRDIAGNIIFVGSTLSDPSHEWAFDVFPGVVTIDEDDGKIYVKYQSRRNKNGCGIQRLTKNYAARCLVIDEVKS